MTRSISVQETAPEDERQNALHFMAAVIGLGEDVSLNDIKIDLRHSQLIPPMRWQAVGLSFRLNSDASKVWIGWKSAVELQSRKADAERRPKLSGLWLKPGDALTIDELAIEDVRDPVLMKADRTRAKARIMILQANGTQVRPSASMLFSDPLLMEMEDGLAVRSYWVLLARLGSLERIYKENKSAYEQKARSALKTAKKIFGELQSAIAASKSLAPSEIEVLTIPHLAAAFGYAVGIAEAEFSVRREVRAGRRKRSEGGKVRAQQQKSRADAWKGVALRFARESDRSPKMLSRERLAGRIERALDPEDLIVRPSRSTIITWLRDEAEQPNGPLRSRRRRRNKT
jgi:hypothetical protein